MISLTVQSQVAQVIPPATTPRHVTVTYWHSGALISGLQGLHSHAVTDALLKMGQQLLDQYKTDQPPAPIGAQVN